MEHLTTPEPIRLVTVPEISRRAKACTMTVYRHIERLGLKPDAILVGAGKRTVSAFVESRAEQIIQQISV